MITLDRAELLLERNTAGVLRAVICNLWHAAAVADEMKHENAYMLWRSLCDYMLGAADLAKAAGLSELESELQTLRLVARERRDAAH